VAFIYVAGLSGIFIFLAGASAYAALVAVANLVYRASHGRFFRWISPWTIIPLIPILIASMVLSFAAWSNYSGPK
jgi:hypothetical protein